MRIGYAHALALIAVDIALAAASGRSHQLPTQCWRIGASAPQLAQAETTTAAASTKRIIFWNHFGPDQFQTFWLR